MHLNKTMNNILILWVFIDQNVKWKWVTPCT